MELLEKIESLIQGFDCIYEVDEPRNPLGTFFISIKSKNKHIVLQFNSFQYGISHLTEDVYYGQGCDESFVSEEDFLNRLKEVLKEF